MHSCSSFNRSFLRATAYTAAPSLANSFAISLPIPELAPVTMATFPCNFMIFPFSLFVFHL